MNLISSCTTKNLQSYRPIGLRVINSLIYNLNIENMAFNLNFSKDLVVKMLWMAKRARHTIFHKNLLNLFINTLTLVWYNRYLKMYIFPLNIF